ncbi:unnamed protein product [Penicillium camemberti]|uniref:Str. FM013 n=1 Tax=Penicillium camemberti (strain FM 013) TaxID=1429867 RepID=A0A0G4P6R8_PENC3|nr:unnamed protein product [Penicillium camemberti]
MPPIRSQRSTNSTEQEVPRTTLRHRLSGIQYRAISRANLRKLT